MSCASMHQSWSGAEAEEVEWRWRRQSGGGGSRRWLEVGGEGEGRSYHDITPLLCCYVSEWHEVVRVGAGEEGGGSGCWRGNLSTVAGAFTFIGGCHTVF